jgi:hypothetical protein
VWPCTSTFKMVAACLGFVVSRSGFLWRVFKNPDSTPCRNSATPNKVLESFISWWNWLTPCIARLKALIPPNKWNYWHVHEKDLCRFLGLKTKDGSPCHNQLSEILSARSRGYKGNRRFDTQEATGNRLTTDDGPSRHWSPQWTQHSLLLPWITQSKSPLDMTYNTIQ